jgi:hypothetical protein
VTRARWLASGWARLLAAFVAPLVAAVILVPFRTHLANAAAALVLVAVVVGVASLGDRLAGYVAAVSATLWFDYFLTVPYERLAITHRHDIETAIGLLVVGIAVTEIGVRRRHHRSAAIVATDHVATILEMSNRAARGEAVPDLIAEVAAELTRRLHLRGCRFEETPPARRGVPVIEADGRVVNAGLVWPVEEVGLPGPVLEAPVSFGGTMYGRFALTPTPGRPVHPDDLRLTVVLCNEIGAVLADRSGWRPLIPPLR